MPRRSLFNGCLGVFIGLLSSTAAADCTLRWSVSGVGIHDAGTSHYPSNEACATDRLAGVQAIKQLEPTLREARKLGYAVDIAIGECICHGLQPVPPQRDPRDEKKEGDRRDSAKRQPLEAPEAQQPAGESSGPPHEPTTARDGRHHPVYEEIKPEEITASPADQTLLPPDDRRARHSPGAYSVAPAAPPQVDDLFKSAEEQPSGESGPWLCGTLERPLENWSCPRCSAQVPCNEPAVVQHSNYECPKRPGASLPRATAEGSGDAVDVGGTELEESQYFYDLQMRRTGVGRSDVSPASSAQPDRAPPLDPAGDPEPSSALRGASPGPPDGDESTHAGVIRQDPNRRAHHPTATPPPPTVGSDNSCREYKEYDNGVVQGTSWIAGLNRPKLNEKLRPEAERRLYDQLRLAGKLRKEDVENVESKRRAGNVNEATEAQTAALKRVFNPNGYDFMIGVAARHETFIDLLERVATGDEFTNGAFSASTQPLYASLKGRSFQLLNCHSNGAMVCLAALTGDCPDVKAVDVRLFGPQITPSSVGKWQHLLDAGRVRSVAIYINKGDPIAPASFAGGVAARRVGLGVGGFGVASTLLSYESLRASINRLAPGISVTFFDFCPEKHRQMAIFGESLGSGKSLEDSTGTFESRPQPSEPIDTPNTSPFPQVDTPETSLGWTIGGGLVGLFPELLGYDVTFACHGWTRYERLLKAQKVLKAKYGTESGVR